MLPQFGVRRETVVHNVLNKTHNGINTCYYLLKQAMKDNGSLVEGGGAGKDASGKSVVVSSAAYGGSGGKSVRPLSAPANKSFARRGVGGGSAAAPAAVAQADKDLDDEEEDSFIKEDVDSGSEGGGSGEAEVEKVKREENVGAVK